MSSTATTATASPGEVMSSTATRTATESAGEVIQINMTDDQEWFSSGHHCKSIIKQMMENDVEIEFRLNQNIILRDNLRMALDDIKAKRATFSIVDTCEEQENSDNNG